jgi:long-chain acyl-CoA synthetase
MTLNLALLLRESAKQHPTKAALVAGPASVTYAELDLRARRFAGALRDLGVERGDRVAVMLPNVPQFSIAYFGILYAGAVVVPLNVLLTGHEVAYHLADSQATALVVWEGFLEPARNGFHTAASCAHLIVASAGADAIELREGEHDFSALTGRAQPVDDLAATTAEDTAVILYTSGTTGKPKGAELTQFNMFFNAHYSRTMLIPMSPKTVALATLPLFHSFGQTVMHNAVLGAGGTVVLLPRFDPDAALGLMQRRRVNLFGGVPTMYFALLNHPEAERYDISSLEHCVSGGSAMPIEVMKAFDAKYAVNVLEGYGLSETSPVASFNRLDRPKKTGSVGLPIWGVEFRLEDSNGKIITGTDEPGEICIKGHNVMKGYWANPEATEESIKDGWFRTGDVGTRDEDGYYYIVDRKKDMIIRGGFNVYPREIEEVLYAHPAVSEAAVLGVPHESHGEEVKAVVALRAGADVTVDALIAYCKERLAAYKYPRIVEFRDALPKGPTGKILKLELR